MNSVQRVLLLLKVLALLSLGMSTAWAHNPVQGGVLVSAVQSGQGKALQLAKSESESGDEDQGGDDSTPNAPSDGDSDDEDDSQT